MYNNIKNALENTDGLHNIIYIYIELIKYIYLLSY